MTLHPQVFFQLACLTRLALSPVGAQLTHLTFRLPRRNLLSALTEMPPSSASFTLATPFPALRHLDLSTTHVADDLRVPIMLKLYPKLETLVLDRCEGLVSRDAVEEPTALATLRWLGKCCGGVGVARADDIVRTWRRVVKERPADAPSLPATGTADVVAPVRDVLVLPPPCTLRSLGLGLHDRLPPRVVKKWERAFRDGYEDALDRAEERADEAKERWERWSRTGKLEEATRRVVVFRDALAGLELLPAVGPFDPSDEGARERGEAPLDPDPLFARFCHARGLVPLSPLAPPAQVASLSLAHTASYHSRADAFSLCLTPDCSNRPGVPHLTLNPASGTGREDPHERREREKRVWEQERRDEIGSHNVAGWRRPVVEHKAQCAHLVGREAWCGSAIKGH